MTIRFLTAKYTGVKPLLMNNPQSVDPFNEFARAAKKLTSKRTKTDDDLLELRRIEIAAKIYFDDELGLYVPSKWVLEAVAQNSHAIAKIAKKKMRGGIFSPEERCKLTYENMHLVKTAEDIIGNKFFQTQMILPQGLVRVTKAVPVFKNWSFECKLEFDDFIVDQRTLENILSYSAHYGGMGDFRPTFGIAKVEFE